MLPQSIFIESAKFFHNRKVYAFSATHGGEDTASDFGPEPTDGNLYNFCI